MNREVLLRHPTGFNVFIMSMFFSLCFMSICCKQVQTYTPGPPQVSYVEIQPEAVTLETELPGRTSAYLFAEIRPQVNGIIQERAFTEGSDFLI